MAQGKQQLKFDRNPCNNFRDIRCHRRMDGRQTNCDFKAKKYPLDPIMKLSVWLQILKGGLKVHILISNGHWKITATSAATK